MKKRFYLIIIFIISMFVANPSIEAITVNESDILYNSYVIGTYLYTAHENDIYNTTGLETIYDEDTGLFTKEIMLAATTINGNKYEDMIVYYKDFWDVWGDGLSGDDIAVGDTFEITHVNGICIDPSCSGNSINIKFKFNDTVTSDKDVSVNYGEVISSDLIPATSSRTGYEFACWTLEGEDECFDLSTKLTEDIVLEAKWNLFTYTITFKDDVHNLSETVESCSFAAGNECSFLDYKDVFSAVPEGYTFVGWSLATSGEKVYSEGNYKELFSNNENITLYAIFNSGTYTVSYNLDGGTFGFAVSPVTEYDPANLTYTLYEPSRIGYTFNGWSLDSSSVATAYIDNKAKEFTISKLGNVVLKANWTPITYTLVYNNTTLASCTYDVICSIDTSLIDVPDGKELTKLEVVINNTNYEVGNKVKNLVINSGEYSVVPTIEDISYTISYDLKGGSLTKENDTSLVVGNYTDLNVPTKDGYEFVEWSVVSGNASIQGNKLTLNGATDVKVIAVWEANNYKLSYGGTDYADCTYDMECELNRMSSNPTGYTFNGWKLKGSDEVLGDVVYNLTTEAITLDIEPILSVNSYNVTYDLASGTINVINPSKYVYGDKTLEVVQPTRVGYVFGGWSSNNNLVVPGTDKVSVDGATGDVKLTAIWNAKEYRIAFAGTGVSALPQDCVYDQECKIKDYIPENGDLVFAGWEYNGYIYQSEEIINLDVSGGITFVAKWVNDDKYEITYNLDRGHFESEPVRMYIIGDAITLPTPNRDGYEFAGWYTDESLENIVEGSVLITDKANIKLYAAWTPIAYRLIYNNEVLASCTYALDCSFSTDMFIIPDGHELTKIYATIDNVKYEIGTKVKNLAVKNSDIEVTIETEELGYDIAYDLDGGKVSQDNPIKIAYMKEKALVEPTKTGYTFKGWDVIVGNADVTNTTVKLTNVEDIKLKALWEANTYKLTYNNTNYATCTYDVECTLNGLETDKWPTGKIFVHWVFNDESLGSKVLNLTSVNDAVLDITPLFEDYNVLITYDYKGGSVTDTNPDRVFYQEEITLVEPTRVGYKFVSWTIEAGDAEIDGNTLTVTGAEDIKLSVLWYANTYEVKYDGKVYGTCTYGEECPVTNLEEDKWPDGKTFDYWSLEGVKLGSVVRDLTTIDKDVLELVPVFKDIEYSISYDLDGGKVATNNIDRITYNSEKTLVEPTKVGYTFNGWEVVSGDVTVTNTSIKLNNIGDVSLKAKWNVNAYTLQYNGETYATCTYDVECAVADLTEEDWQEGKKFINWMYNGKDLGDVVYNLTSQNNKVLNIEPKYENITYYILYNYDGGTVSSVNVATYNVESRTITLNEPTKFGYEFREFKIDDENSRAILVGNTLNINGNVGNISITAFYDINTYNVTYDLDGGLSAIDGHTCTVDSCTLSDVVPTKDKYDFGGWIDSNNGYIYEAGDSIPITADVTLKAKWTNKDSYKINYHLDGGSFIDEDGNEIAPNTSYYAGETPVLTNAKKTGYVFEGWLIDNTGDPVKSIDSVLNKDLDLYAKFTATTYKVTYAVGDYLDSDDTIEYTYGTKYELVDYVSKFEAKGYKFLGWKLDANTGLYLGNGLSFMNLEGGLTDVTLYPVVEVIEDDYTISYYLDGGSFVNPDDVAYSYNEGDVIPLPEVKKPGYEFAAWKMSDENIIDGTETDINKDVVLIPLWNKITEYKVTLLHEFDESITPVVLDCTVDEACAIPVNTVVREGYTFDGWLFQMTGEGGNSTYLDGEEIIISWETIVDQGTTDFVLKAQWTLIEYNIDYDGLDGNSVELPSKYSPLDEYIRIPMSIDTNSNGASLVAWELNDTILDTCTDDSNYACILVDDALSDITVTAHYSDEVYAVSWSYNYRYEDFGGSQNIKDSGVINVVYGSYIEGLPEEASDDTKSERISDWAFSDGTILDLATYRVTSNISIEAVFPDV